MDVLDLDQIDAVLKDADKPKKGFIDPGINQAISNGEIVTDMSALIDWPTKKDGTAKTLAEQATAIEQNIKNHKTKVLLGKAVARPELEAVVATLPGSTEPTLLLVNKDLLAAAKAAKAAKK